MKHNGHILLIVALLLQGCDFFYSTVEYKGKEAQPRMCVIAHLNSSRVSPRVDVLHSEFFLHSNNSQLPILEDAQVTVQVNNESPVDMPFLPKQTIVLVNAGNGRMYRDSIGYYSAPVSFQGNDTVRLHIEHPEYGSADAMQICPMKQQFALEVDSVSKYCEIWCHMHLPAYTGSMTDVLTLDINSTTAYMWIDTTLEVVSLEHYSQDETFAVYDNYQTPAGYFAGNNLTFPVSATDRTIAMVLVSDTFKLFKPSNLSKVHKMWITMELWSQTQDDYKYYTSLDNVMSRSSSSYSQSHYTAKYIPELPSAKDTITQQTTDPGLDIAKLLSEIAEEFNVLGNAEGYQVYSNISGSNRQKVQPFGCFSLTNIYHYETEYIMPAGK